jgi:hypothetical protein
MQIVDNTNFMQLAPDQYGFHKKAVSAQVSGD